MQLKVGLCFRSPVFYADSDLNWLRIEFRKHGIFINVNTVSISLNAVNGVPY